MFSISEGNNSKVTRFIEVPMATLTQYFPIFNYSSKEYLNLYSRMIVDCLHNEEGYQDDPDFGGLFFSINIYCCKTDMVEYGKYYSVVSA